MYRKRIWAVKHAKFLYAFYNHFIKLLRATKFIVQYLPITPIEKIVKETLFDCQMCGNCILSSTGMSCPMNCPKGIRNGPCGGVRLDGGCEVIHDMPCVWVLAYEGNKNMNNTEDNFQPPLEHSLIGSSSWLKEIQK
jgi:hypothetical protein